MSEFIKAITTTKIGQAFDNLLRATMGDGFKSKCVVASYFIMFRCSIISLCIFIVMLVIYAIGIFTSIPVAGDIMVEYIKVLLDLYRSIMSFFAIAVTTTMGATAFELFAPNGSGSKQMNVAPNSSEGA